MLLIYRESICHYKTNGSQLGFRSFVYIAIYRSDLLRNSTVSFLLSHISGSDGKGAMLSSSGIRDDLPLVSTHSSE